MHRVRTLTFASVFFVSLWAWGDDLSSSSSSSDVSLNTSSSSSLATTAVSVSSSSATRAVRTGTYVLANTTFQIYGHLDVSADGTSKGIANRTIAANDVSNPAPGSVYTAQGNLGFMPQMSTNLSYLGLKGVQTISPDLKGIFQIETQVDLTATPGSTDNNASADNAVKGAWASRNSFLGIMGSWGSLKAGKNDTPYKSSTAKMDPFSGTVGDYNAIMGNTGGDNRAEFDARLSHAIWFESANYSGFNFAFMYSPGQNRATDDSNIPAGEPSCSGGNNPLNKGQICGDGSYGDAWSFAANYKTEGVLATAAYEVHRGVNRTGDEGPNGAGLGGGAPVGAVGVADEIGAKAGVQYTMGATTLNFIYENMTRNAPDPNFNERQRSGYWLAATQKFAKTDSISLGWGHAGKTPGDPGDPTVVDPDGTTTGGPKDNAADLYSLGYWHYFPDNRTSAYVVYATTRNHPGAHYDLGASGHGIMTDCHDATLNAGGFSGGGGICFTGGALQAVSVGLSTEF